jgi:hypothetical protein
MSDTQIVLIYSKYSPHCKPILDIISEVNDKRVKFVCIDNKSTREKILSSKSIHIRSVPCIILKHRSGTIEKFEGENVGEWIQSNIALRHSQNDIDTKPKVTQIAQIPTTPQESLYPVEEYNKPITIPDKPPFDIHGGMQPYVSATASKKSTAEIARQAELERESMESGIKAVSPYPGIDPSRNGGMPPPPPRPNIPQMGQPPVPNNQHPQNTIGVISDGNPSQQYQQPPQPQQYQQPPQPQQYQQPPQPQQYPQSQPQQYQQPPQPQQYQQPPQPQQYPQSQPQQYPQSQPQQYPQSQPQQYPQSQPQPQQIQVPILQPKQGYQTQTIEQPKMPSGKSATDRARQLEQSRESVQV